MLDVDGICGFRVHTGCDTGRDASRLKTTSE